MEDSGIEAGIRPTKDRDTASERGSVVEDSSLQSVDETAANFLDRYAALGDMEPGEERDRERQEINREVVEQLVEQSGISREEAKQLVHSRIEQAVTVYQGLLSQAIHLEHTSKQKYEDVMEKIRQMKEGVFPIETPESAQKKVFRKAA